MYSTRKLIWYFVMLFIGLSLIVLAALGYIENYFSGFGSGLSSVAIVKIVLAIKYRKDEEYAKKKDLSENDERNIFISNKAKSWSFFLTILIFAILTVVLMSLGYEYYSLICSFEVCLMLIIYFIAYLILRKKY